MNPTIKYEYIDLQRTFRELSKQNYVNDDEEISRLFGLGDALRWSDLISEYRLIILSEAGSGKTEEIRNAASELRKLGKHAFFLRLEHIANDFEDAFEIGTFEGFEEWLSSGEEGWLLLDSVDEARLRNPSDFELAIKKLSRRIRLVKDNTHIVITGRTYAWRPRTDLALCTSHLPYTITKRSGTQKLDEGDNTDESSLIDKDNKNKTESVFKIVSLDDLTSDQITSFLKARGIETSQVFLDAVERADAWSFTSRPQDLEELIEFWIDNGRIGTRLEIMRNSIERRLTERDQNRADINPLSKLRSLEGARILAAATTLVQDPTIRVPDGADNTKGIAVQSILPDWDDNDQSTLLSRPIFNEAIYGAVRFHHRSVREYLTAEWFSELLKDHTSRLTIERLFFRNQYELEIITPTLRPILPWLIILDEGIRIRVLKVAPEIVFEGGDPSQLPIETRRIILKEVCEKISEGFTDRSMHDYSAVQRFANSDLTDDIRKLIRQYSKNIELTEFLLRMIWLGQIKGALPEAMEVALLPTAKEYTRIAAFRAIKAIGTDEDQIRIRKSFLSEAPELKRSWLAELLDDIKPSEESIKWVLESIEKSEEKDRYAHDYITDKITEFVEESDIELLQQLLIGFNKLLNHSPVIERRYCEVSKKFQWLMQPASRAIERLIEARNVLSLEPIVLSILRNLSAARGYGSNEFTEVKTNLSKLVPKWKELNRELFWFDVEKTREAIDKKSCERMTDYWHASIFGSFWSFEESEYQYISEQISLRTFQDDRLVALSLAFNLYKSAKRPRKWREQLKKLVIGNDELSERLDNYLRPPAQGENDRSWKKQQAKWERQDESRRKKEEKIHEDWKSYLNENLDELNTKLQASPGTLSNSLYYLFRVSRNEDKISSRWTEYNWKKLISGYGKDVATFYRDSTVSFWRNYQPKLRSEGAPFNSTKNSVIIGLTGLEIEYHETSDWPQCLNTNEAELACKYASFELSGFPTWFPTLFSTHPKVVNEFLLQELSYELSIESKDIDIHYIIDDLSYSGQWAWDYLAPNVYKLLKREPKKLTNLDSLLKIIMGSELSDDLIKVLAKRKCYTLKKLDHAARWFAVWASVAPNEAIPSLKARIENLSNKKDQTFFAMTFITHLLGGRRSNGINTRKGFKRPEYLKSIYLLMYEYIRSEEDIERSGKGVYSPDLRDDAQDARSNLFNMLKQIPSKESYLAIMEIAKAHPVESSRPWMLHHAKEMAEQEGDIEAWSPIQVREFQDNLERTPSNHKDLQELAVLRLLDLKDDLEHGDSSIASILLSVTQETDMRKFIGRELREKAKGRYSIPQEEELADAKRPDLRFHGIGFDGPVPVELKLADNSWGGPKLFERLENQLCGDYLRDNRSNLGIFVLVYRGEKPTWELPGSRRRVDFSGLVEALQKHWLEISPKFPKVDNVTVIGIDLTKRLG